VYLWADVCVFASMCVYVCVCMSAVYYSLRWNVCVVAQVD
jgi:hypothetical protein